MSCPNSRQKESAGILAFLLANAGGPTFFCPLMATEEPKQMKNPMELTHFDVEQLSRFVTDTGKILPRRITGMTARHQRHVTKVIKQARNLLLMK
jgi:small subunit ribosomal protein S18